MMSLAQSLFGLGSMALPIVTSKVLHEYGFRGCMAVIAAMNAHTIFAMILMHPVEWHFKGNNNGKLIKYLFVFWDI